MRFQYRSAAAMLLALTTCTPGADFEQAEADRRAAEQPETASAPSAEASSARAEERGVEILVPEDLLPLAADVLERHPTLRLTAYVDVPDMVQKVDSADAVIGWTITNNAMRRGTNLRWVHVYTGGVNSFLSLPRLGPGSDVTLTSMKIQKGPEVADHAMALLLSLTRNMPGFMRNQRARRWENSPELPVIELRGKTMLIVGMGGIGTQLAERAHAHGMRVIGTDAKDLPFMAAVDYVGRPDELLRLLPEADVVAICAPLTPDTEGLIDSEAFGAMKDGAYLVSVSRGEIVSTDALVQALRSGKLIAAGLDVIDPEPLPPNHPLWDMPNVVLTPHMAGLSDGRVVRQEQLALENIDRFMRGLPLKNVVDQRRGF